MNKQLYEIEGNQRLMVAIMSLVMYEVTEQWWWLVCAAVWLIACAFKFIRGAMTDDH